MANYTSKSLRNICVAGHGTSGKTTLVESILFTSGSINRMGKVEEGNTVSDFTEEEKNRGISISASVNAVDFKDNLLTFVDNPGYFDFAGELSATMPFCEACLLTVKASAGLDAGTQNAYMQAKKLNKSVAFFITEIDRDNLNVDKTLNSIVDELEIPVAPITYPAETGPDVSSIIDVLKGKLIKYANGKEFHLKKFQQNLPIKLQSSEKNLWNPLLKQMKHLWKNTLKMANFQRPISM